MDHMVFPEIIVENNISNIGDIQFFDAVGFVSRKGIRPIKN